MEKIWVLMLGGALGTLSRYGITVWANHLFGHFPTSWLPYGTLAANMLGCLLMGIMLALSEHTEAFSPLLRLMLITGFLGALTTFSTFELETFYMTRGEMMLGRLLIYVGGSVIVGLLLLWGAYSITRQVSTAG